MIRRIVKLSFKPENILAFQQIFAESKDKIVNMPGCHSVDLLHCTEPSNIFFTFSIWDSEADLNAYRHSELFQKTWARTKVLFNDRPQAWSTQLEDGATG
ncbi:MAG: putative quinol monooxygenase [Saprospiraceae bacterium]